ncbi:MAG: hypothetical protein ACRC6G_07825, partial [Deefgea sp.]
MNTPLAGKPYALLAYCRPGFEPECAEEIADHTQGPG